MMCKIEDCNHTISRRGRMRDDNSWAIYGICPCCCNELELLPIKPSPRCNNYIEEEIDAIKHPKLKASSCICSNYFGTRVFKIGCRKHTK